MAKEIRIQITSDSKDFIQGLNKIEDASYKSEKTISQLSNQVKNLSVFQEKGSAVNHVLTASWADLVTKLDKASIVYRELYGDIEGLVKAQKELQKVLQTQLQYGADENIQKFLLEKNWALQEEIDSKKKAAKAEEELRKEKEETLALWLKEKQAHEEEVAHNAKVALQNQEIARKRREQAAAAKEDAEIARLTAEAVAEEARQKEELATNVMVALGDKVGLLQAKYRQLEAELKESIKTTGVSSEKTKKLATEMKNLSKEIQKANYTPFNVRIKNLLSSFVSAQAILWGVRSAFRLVTNTISDSMKVASEAEETWNLFVTTFNNVETTAINASNAIASSMGLATSTAQKALGVFGDLALGYGQTDAAALEFAETLTKASLDLISYKNLTGSYDEIFSSIASGIAGNVENFRKYGVVITQAEVKTRLQQKGLDKLTGSSLQFAQMQERMNIFIEKTANAQGDMVKTMESTENVTRRLSEATKEWKENVGENWNKVLTPVKSAIADYLDEINRAQKATEQFLAGETNINVNAGLSPEERKAEIAKKLKTAATSGQQFVNQVKLILSTYQTGYDELYAIAAEKGNQQVISQLERNEEDVRAAEETYKRENKTVTALENKTQALIELQQSYSNLADTLNEIEGIDFAHAWKDVFLNKNGNDVIASADYHKQENDKYLFEELKATIDSLTNKELSAFSTAVENALNIESEADQMEDKLESIKKLWEELYNYFALTEGISEDEQKILDAVAESYDTVNARLDDHNKKIEEEKARLDAVQSAIQSITNAAESYQSKIEEQALSSRIKTQFAGSSDEFINNEIARASALASNKAMFDLQAANATEEELAKLVENLNLANSAVNEYYDILQKQIELEEREAKVKAASDMQASYDSAFANALQWNVTPMIPTFSANAVSQEYGADLYSSLMSSIDQMVSEMESAGVDQANIDAAEEAIRVQGLSDIRQLVALNEEEQKNAWKGETKDILMGGLGEVGDIFNALSSASGLGGLVTIFADLAVQTEAFQRVASLLSDNVLPVLNAFLEPLLPLIEMVGDQIQSIVETVLEPLFPILKAIVKVAITVQTWINAVTGFVADSIKAMVGKVVYWVTDALNSIEIFGKHLFNIDNQWAQEWASIDVGGNFSSKFDKMNQYLASIDKMSMEIADNTDPSKSEALKVYEDLYKSGTLSATQYSGYLADLAGNRYDKVGVLASGLSYQKKNGGTYVAKQNVSIQIDGSNLSEDQLVSAIQKALDTSTSPGGNTYAYGVA